MIENLKNIILEIENKKEFSAYIANHFNINNLHVYNRWFGKKIKVPEEYIEEVISIAQKKLAIQIEHKRKVLINSK